MVMWPGSKEYIILRAYYTLPVNPRLTSPNGSSQGCVRPLENRDKGAHRVLSETSRLRHLLEFRCLFFH